MGLFIRGRISGLSADGRLDIVNGPHPGNLIGSVEYRKKILPYLGWRPHSSGHSATADNFVLCMKTGCQEKLIKSSTLPQLVKCRLFTKRGLLLCIADHLGTCPAACSSTWHWHSDRISAGHLRELSDHVRDKCKNQHKWEYPVEKYAAVVEFVGAFW